MHLEAIRAGTRERSGEERFLVARCSRVWLLRGKDQRRGANQTDLCLNGLPVSGSPRMSDGC